MSSFLDGSSDGSSFSQVTRITIKARMSLNFSQIPLLTTELYGVTHNAYQSLYLFFFLSLQWKFLSQISQLLLEPVFPKLCVHLQVDKVHCVNEN